MRFGDLAGAIQNEVGGTDVVFQHVNRVAVGDQAVRNGAAELGVAVLCFDNFDAADVPDRRVGFAGFAVDPFEGNKGVE